MPFAEATPPTQELPLPQSHAEPPGSLRLFLALAAAVRAHRVVTTHAAVPTRPKDHALYRRLAEIEAWTPIPGDGTPS
jgi:hypothetical protein